MANRILQWNIRGEKVNLCELMLLITTFCPAIICLQETHLKESDTLNIKDFTSYNHISKESNIATGGSSILINNKIPHSKVPLKTNLQAVAVTATLQEAITFCSLYIPPSETMDETKLNDLIQQLPKPFIIMGDFNSHNDLWGSKGTNKRGRIIEKIINQKQLCLFNSKENTYLHPATGTLSAIDLTMCDPAIFMDYNWRVHNDTCGSDHFPIILENENPKLDNKTPRWNLQKANWEKFQNLCQSNLIPEGNTYDEDHVTYFTNTLLSIAEECIPKSTNSAKHSKPWFDDKCKKALRTRRADLRKFKTNPTKENLNKYKNSRAIARRIFKESKRTSWKTYVSKINTNTKIKKVWEMIRKISGKNTSNPSKHLITDNTKITDKQGISDQLAETFAKNSSSKNSSQKFQNIKKNEEKEKINFHTNNTEDYNQPFSKDELKKSLNKAHDTAVGPDQIHYQFIKQLPKVSIDYLLHIYNNIWISGNIPEIWKQATVIPIPKTSKDTTDPTNYRPIALTSCMCKTLERMINSRLTWYLEKNNLITQYQTGFRKQRSPMDHLVRLETFIREAFIQKQHLTAVFFDLEKAYETAWKYGIMKDLKELGLEGRMPIFIDHFLSDRKFRVRQGDTLSNQKEQEMGVPQGSILSVTLFNIKINNIVKQINPGTDCALYVDDFLICYRSKHIHIIERQLQLCLNKISKWTTANGFRFSKEKTKCVHFCQLRKMHHDPELKLDDHTIPVVDQYKYLGIIFDRKLTFIPHIKHLRIKCNKAIQMLRVIAHTNWGADRKTLIKIYRTLIRSKIDYGCFIYGSARKSYLKELETIHHQGLRLALGAFSTSPVESLYTEANETPLPIRRQKLAMQYHIKLATCPSNPAYNCVFQPQYKTLYDRKENAIKPFGLRMEGLTTKAQMDTTQVHRSIISKTPPWLLKQPTVLLDLSKHPKTKTNPITFQEETLIIKNDYPDYLHIYTDGSKSGDRVGCAAVLNNTKSLRRLPNKSSIYSAEILAIDLALDIITAN